MVQENVCLQQDVYSTMDGLNFSLLREKDIKDVVDYTVWFNNMDDNYHHINML